MSTGRIKPDTKLVRITTDLKLLSGFEFGDAVVRHGRIPAAFIATPANLAASFVPAEETARTAIQIPLHSITNTTNNFVSTLPKHLAKSIKAVTTVTGSLSSLAIRGAKWFVQPLVQMAESFAYGTSFNMVFGGDSKTSDTKIKRDAQDRLDALHDNTIFEPGVGEDFDDIRETKTPEELLATLGFDLAGNWILGKKVDDVSPDIF